MYYVYILRSIKDKKFYIGKTQDLKNRFKEHNDGKVFSTKGRRPLQLVYYEAFKYSSDCGREELFLKSGIGRDSLRHRLKSLKYIGEV
jgi:putative endonuclease